jgi:hypothetical protein
VHGREERRETHVWPEFEEGTDSEFPANCAGNSCLAPVQERTPRFVVKPWPLGLNAGIYEGKLGQLLDQLETEDFIRKMSE